MLKRQINLVAFDIPYPVDYGGVIDIYYKIKAFNDAGVKVHLHCFQYSREPSEELNKICESVKYYPRQVSKAHLFNLKPYIVVTRESNELLCNLQKNDFPVLFEGLHCCYYLNHKHLQNRIKVVRTHNIEHNYYHNLATVERVVFRKYYFLNEAAKLKRYEKVLVNADALASISKSDCEYYSGIFKNVSLVSAFHPNENVNINEGTGKYCLYHGSLEVGENNEAAMFLVNKVFNDIKTTLIIAGNRPSQELRQAAVNHSNIEIKDNITTEEIYELISNAQINILPTFQSTGIKLKLLASLFSGRHCIVNSFMVNNTGLETLCTVTDKPEEMKKEIIRHMKLPFKKEDISLRENILNNSIFSNKSNISQLIKLLFP